MFYYYTGERFTVVRVLRKKQATVANCRQWIYIFRSIRADCLLAVSSQRLTTPRRLFHCLSTVHAQEGEASEVGTTAAL